MSNLEDILRHAKQRDHGYMEFCDGCSPLGKLLVALAAAPQTGKELRGCAMTTTEHSDLLGPLRDLLRDFDIVISWSQMGNAISVGRIKELRERLASTLPALQAGMERVRVYHSGGS